MKKLLIVLILSIIPLALIGQKTNNGHIHVSAGMVDIQDRSDGYTISSEIGYTHFFTRYGVGVNYRNTSVYGDIYNTWEIHTKYRIFNNPKYRMTAGVGAGYNMDDFDIHPMATFRNSILLEPGTWFHISIDNSYRNSKDYFAPGWRLETYVMFGLTGDIW